jgi:hypothetical protein
VQNGNTAKHYVSRAQNPDQFSQQTATSFDSAEIPFRKSARRRNDRARRVERRSRLRAANTALHRMQDARAGKIRQPAPRPE